jgi:superoxide dismutase, Cu-Zn family
MKYPVFSLAALVLCTSNVNGAAMAHLEDAVGKSIGHVTVTQVPAGLLLSGTFNGLSAREQAVHVHTVGLCEGPKFASAKGHWNPAARQHGLHNPQGFHQGDIPNLRPDKTGKARLTGFIGGATLAQLMDADGASVVIHAGPDDNMTDPAGNAGDRVACGVVHLKP